MNVISNKSEHMGGTGKPPEQIAQKGAQILICSGLGPRAIGMFESYGIEVYVGAQGSARQAVEMWRAGKLQKASDENACKEHRH